MSLFDDRDPVDGPDQGSQDEGIESLRPPQDKSPFTELTIPVEKLPPRLRELLANAEKSEDGWIDYKDLPDFMQHSLTEKLGDQARNVKVQITGLSLDQDKHHQPGTAADDNTVPVTFGKRSPQIDEIENEVHETVKKAREQKDAARKAVEMLSNDIADKQRKIALIRQRYGLEDEAAEERDVAAGEITRDLFKKRVHNAIDLLPERVKGQNHAIDGMISALKRAAMGTRDPERPLLTVMEMGPTGVGKTHLARILHQALAADENGPGFEFKKIDCSEYSHGHEGARLTGAPPGYLGFDSGTELDQIKRNPYHVVVFDEIEKASAELRNTLLQILEDGELTQGDGSKVDFTHCIVILTSNVGAREVSDQRDYTGIGFSNESGGALGDSEIEKTMLAALKKQFKPEFINRLDKLITFYELPPDVVIEIAQNEVNDMIGRAEVANGTTIRVAPEVYTFIADEGFSPEYGARQIRRVIQDYLEQPLAEEMFELSDEQIMASSFSIEMEAGKPAVKHLLADLEINIVTEGELDTADPWDDWDWKPEGLNP